jgi:hypothetical protein
LGRFQVEDQILHIKSQLAECILDQVENAAATFGTIHDPIQNRFDSQAIFRRQVRDQRGQLDHVRRNLFWIRRVVSSGHVHSMFSRLMC